MSVDVTYSTMTSPVGDLLLTLGEGALTGIYLDPHKGRPEIGDHWYRDDGALAPFREQLDEYFAGRRTTFSMTLAPRGTIFQRQVWDQLAQIPYGQTITYRNLATRVGNPKATRAVGLATGRNPISIVVPCHRVIGSDGRLTGYAGGVDRKTWLLTFERGTTSEGGPTG